MVVPRYVLDNCKHHVRNIIAQEGGNLLAAYRFSDDWFADAKVTVDVIFLQKSHPARREWVETRKIKIDNQIIYLNDYFHRHPQHILGNLELFEGRDRPELTCRQHNKQELIATLRQCIAAISP